VKHLLATVGCLAAIFLIGGLDHLFPSGIWTALGVTLVFVTIGLVAAVALRLLWHGLLRLGVVHHYPPSFRVHGGARPTSTCIAGRPSRTPFCPRRAACSVSSWQRRTARRGRSGSESSWRSRSPASSSGGMGRRAYSTAPQRS
jgi:hypothetical protein